MTQTVSPRPSSSAIGMQPMPACPPPLANTVEPPQLLAHFTRHPSNGFTPLTGADELPGFVTDFDLLTTASDSVRRVLRSVPGMAALRRLFVWRTTFLGSTVTEYAPLPMRTAADDLARLLLERWANATRMLVVKDIPEDSPLLCADDNARNRAFLAACARAGFVILEGQALAYVPIDFASEDEYLARLSYSRRKDLRRKLRARAQLDIEALPTGHAVFDDDAFAERLYALYLQVYAQSEIHFDCLHPAFLRAVLRDAGLDGIVFLYRTEQKLIGFNLCFVHRGKLIDKYIGLDYAQARSKNLYFVSWMHNLEFARRRGLTHYVAGWTDPRIKAYLGARFTFTRHVIYLRNPLLRAIARRVSRHFENDRDWRAAAQ